MLPAIEQVVAKILRGIRLRKSRLSGIIYI